MPLPKLVSWLLMMLMVALPAWSADQSSQSEKTPPARLDAPGTLSGYPASPRQQRPALPPARRPPVMSAPSVLRFHEEGRTLPPDPFSRTGRTPAAHNPWGQAPGRPAPPPAGVAPRSRSDMAAAPANPWSLDEQLLSSPGIPGLDRSLPLAPADPLLSPPLYGPGWSTPMPYGYYPGSSSGMPLMPFDGGWMPGMGNDSSRFPFSPMGWF